MKIKLDRYYILLFFISFSIILLLILWQVVWKIYFVLANTKEDFLTALCNKVYFGIIFLGAYILFLLLFSLGRFLMGRRKKSVETTKGFLYSFIYSLVIMAAYAAMIMFHLYSVE